MREKKLRKFTTLEPNDMLGHALGLGVFAVQTGDSALIRKLRKNLKILIGVLGADYYREVPKIHLFFSFKTSLKIYSTL